MKWGIVSEHPIEAVEHKGVFTSKDALVISELFRTLIRLRLMKDFRTVSLLPQRTYQLSEHKYTLGKNACCLIALT